MLESKFPYVQYPAAVSGSLGGKKREKWPPHIDLCHCQMGANLSFWSLLKTFASRSPSQESAHQWMWPNCYYNNEHTVILPNQKGIKTFFFILVHKVYWCIYTNMLSNAERWWVIAVSKKLNNTTIMLNSGAMILGGARWAFAHTVILRLKTKNP